MNHSLFNVYYAASSGTPIAERVILGIATLNGNNPRFRPDCDAQEFFIKQPHGWIVPFQSNVRRMVRGVGHSGKFSCSWDENTGIGVERV